MYFKENKSASSLPLYEVKELTMEEALLVIAAEKEVVSDDSASQASPFWGSAGMQAEPAVG